MAYLKTLFSSKVTWTVIVMFIVGGFHAITGMISPNYTSVIEVLLTLLAAHFNVTEVTAAKAVK